MLVEISQIAGAIAIPMNIISRERSRPILSARPPREKRPAVEPTPMTPRTQRV